MSQILKSIGVGCAAVLLAGCATRYGPYYRWLHTGYTDSRVAPNSFQVAFHGDRQYSQSHAEDFCHLRCAELALKHGYAGYQIRDLIVRTSGEQRLSDFMLWRSAYSEFLFLDKYWPEMTKQDVTDILKEYTRRKRRFGG